MREIFCNLFWTAVAIDKVDLITGDSNQAGQLVKSGAPLVDYNNSLLVQCMEAVVTKVNEQCPPVERVTFQVISNTKAKEYVKMMEAQKWTKETECDGLIAFCIVYGFKQDSVQKIRSLDEYAADRTYREPAKAFECTFFSKENISLLLMSASVSLVQIGMFLFLAILAPLPSRLDEGGSSSPRDLPPKARVRLLRTSVTKVRRRDDM